MCLVELGIVVDPRVVLVEVQVEALVEALVAERLEPAEKVGRQAEQQQERLEPMHQKAPLGQEPQAMKCCQQVEAYQPQEPQVVRWVVR
jgi:hypothetical protein